MPYTPLPHPPPHPPCGSKLLPPHAPQIARTAPPIGGFLDGEKTRKKDCPGCYAHNNLRRVRVFPFFFYFVTSVKWAGPYPDLGFSVLLSAYIYMSFISIAPCLFFFFCNFHLLADGVSFFSSFPCSSFLPSTNPRICCCATRLRGSRGMDMSVSRHRCPDARRACRVACKRSGLGRIAAQRCRDVMVEKNGSYML